MLLGNVNLVLRVTIVWVESLVWMDLVLLGIIVLSILPVLPNILVRLEHTLVLIISMMCCSVLIVHLDITVLHRLWHRHLVWQEVTLLSLIGSIKQPVVPAQEEATVLNQEEWLIHQTVEWEK